MDALMSDPIGVGPWRAEWQTLTPAQMLGQFQNNGLPVPLAVQFSDLDITEITGLLGGQPAEGMLGPDANVVAVLHSSGWGHNYTDDAILFVTEEDGRYSWSAFLYTNGRFADANLEMATSPVGLIYIVWGNAIYQVQTDGSHYQIANTETANIPNLKVSPDGHYAAYLTDDRQLWLIDNATGAQEQLASESNLSYFLMWGDNSTLFTGVWLDPSEGDGPNNGHLAFINLNENGRPLQILDETRLLSNPPALANDGQTIAFDVHLSGPDDSEAISRLYHPDTGITIFDPSTFTASNEMIDQARFIPSWSPDGRFMTWLSSTGERFGLQVYDLQAQTAMQIFDWDPARFGGSVPAPVWSPDGQWLALDVLANGPEGSGIWLVAPDGSSQTLIDQLGHEPHWVNATQLIFSLYEDGPRLYDVNSGETFRLDMPAGGWVLGVTPPADLPDWPESTSPANAADSEATMPDPADLTMSTEEMLSPDGLWQTSISQSEPVVINPNEGDKFYVLFTVTDGNVTWTPVDEWRGYGLGYSWPTVFAWSADGRYLYYTNRNAIDGCSYYSNGTDLTRLDLQDGTMTELLPANTTLNLSLSPDESTLTYIDNGLFVLKTVATGAEQSVMLSTGEQPVQTGEIFWSADGKTAVFTLVTNSCLPNQIHSIIRVDTDPLSATTIVDENQNLTVQDWPDPTQPEIRLLDSEGNTWSLDINSGELAQEE